jgi:nucleotide-binding universal stress UspA family protein
MAHPIRRILVPTDFSEMARHALEYALALAAPLGASVDLLHVWQPPRHVSPDILLLVPSSPAAPLEMVGLAAASRHLLEFVEPYRSHPVPLRTRLEVGTPADVILRVADEGYELIIMGTHGRTGLARFVLGSVARRVATHAPCPVLTLHGAHTAGLPGTGAPSRPG